MEERAQQVNEMYELLDVYEVKIAAQVRDAAAASTTATTTTTPTSTSTSSTTSLTPHVPIAAQDAVKKDDLKEARDTFAAKMADADVAVEQRMPQMTVSLERSIDKLNEDLMSIFTTLHTGEFVDPACDPEAVLERLGEVHAQLSTSRDGGRHSCSHIPTPTFVLRALPLPTTGAHAARGDRRAS